MPCKNHPAIFSRLSFPGSACPLQPDQRALVVVIHAAPQEFSRRSSSIQSLRGYRRIFQIAPRSAWPVIQIRRRRSQILAQSFGLPAAASRRQNHAVVLRQSFINPQQLSPHWLLIIRRRKPAGRRYFPVPRMKKFVRQQIHLRSMMSGSCSVLSGTRLSLDS